MSPITKQQNETNFAIMQSFTNYVKFTGTPIKKKFWVCTMCPSRFFCPSQRKKDIKKGVKNKMGCESTEIDNIINIFIYETGGVKIKPFIPSLFRIRRFLPSIKHQISV